MPQPDSSDLNPVDPAPSQPDQVDKALAQAFGTPKDPAPSAVSVLQILQARTGTELGVHLDSNAPEGAPVMVTPEAKDMRDGSGRYQVLGEIGRGGMGVVYKGRDHDLGRDVAMKVLREDYSNQPEVLARFVEEAQIGGQLQHPGIVPVYDMGLQAGERPYFAMKLVKGETLAAVFLRREDPTEERRRLLGIFEQVCQTMAYAHSRHVVHRDLKPANIMIGAFGEVQIVDWGLAKVLPKGGVADEKASVREDAARSVIATVRSQSGSGTDSVMGSVIGTPAYMPPEQANGDIDRLDERSDVFGLGAMLCEILTGAPPYRALDGDLVRQAANGALDGAYGRLQDCGADAALVTLCTECLARARQARPDSAAEVATRISEYLTSVEDRARQSEVRAAEARYRHRTTLLAAAGGLLLLILGTSAWLWIDADARNRHDQAIERVATARNAASGARGQAQAAGLDPNLWATALASAEQVVALCEDKTVDTDTRSEAAASLATVQQEQQTAAAAAQRLARDAAMRQQLEVLRIPTDDDVRSRAWQVRERRRLDAEYTGAFADYLDGASLFEQEIGAVLSSLQSGDIEPELATALDHWGLVRDGRRNEPGAPDTGTARIRALAAQLDPEDPWRTKLRSLLPDAATEGPRLLALADRADFATMSAAGCRVLAEALWRADEQQAAVTILRRGQQLHPQDFDVCFGLALSLEQLAEPRSEEAAETYRIANALRPSQNEVLHRQGMALETLNRHADAEPLYRMLLARQPNNAHWFFHLGNALMGQGKLDEAIQSFRRAVGIDSRDVRAHGYLGVALRKQGKLDEAIQSFHRALDIDQRDVRAHDHLGIALKMQGKLDEAIQSFGRALKIDPRDRAAHCNLGVALKMQGKLDEAIASYRRALEIDPRYVLAHIHLGIALKMQGKLDEAIQSFHRVLKIDPGDTRAHDNIGHALLEQGKLDEAIQSFSRVLKTDPRNARIHNQLGLALQRQGKLDEAMQSFRRALEFDPGQASAHYNLGFELARQGKPDEAIQSFQRAHEIFATETDPFSVEWAGRSKMLAQVHSRVGTSLKGQGKLDEAIASYHRALEADQDFAPAHFNLGMALEGQGDFEAAISSYRRAFAIWSRREDAFSVEWAEKTEKKIEELQGQTNPERVFLGDRVPGSAREFEAAVRFGVRQKRYTEVVSLTEATLADSPELVGGSWGAYHSACAAALLAASAELQQDPTERTRVRGLARTWLLREVANWRRQLGAAASASEARRMLAHALKDSDFASVRGAALESLPEDERGPWQEMWAAIEDALKTGGR